MKHFYGDRVHLLNDPACFGLLAKLCAPETFQPQINFFIEVLYRQLLLSATNLCFNVEDFQSATRMAPYHPNIHISGTRLKEQQKAVVVNLARAGTYPSHVCYEFLHHFLPAANLRQDHIFAARTTNDSLQVTGTDFGAAKIGGDVEACNVIFPDPMGATGNTITKAITHYKTKVKGPAAQYIALHLIVTPEYLKRVTQDHPDLKIFAFRVDRGLSSPRALAAPLGQFWDEEKGLNDRDYIVPGGGGLGEVMNNSFV